MAGQSATKIIRVALSFLVFVVLVVMAIECSRRYLEHKIEHHSVIDHCLFFVSSSTDVWNLVGKPTNILYQKAGGRFTWSPEIVTGRETFLVQGIKSSMVMKVYWSQGKGNGIEVLKVSTIRPWYEDVIIWKR